MFSIAPNLQTQEVVIIRMLKSFPYEDSHHVPWKYDVSLISTRIEKEEVYSNISSGLFGLTRSGRCYTLEELEKRRKEIGKGIAEPVRNRVITKEAEEFLEIIKIEFQNRGMNPNSLETRAYCQIFKKIRAKC